MKALKFFKVTPKKNLVEIVCLFNDFDETIESETKSLFAFLFFQSKANIKLNLSSVHYFPIQQLFRLLEFARELKADQRALELQHAPRSLVRYIKRFQLDKLIQIERDEMTR